MTAPESWGWAELEEVRAPPLPKIRRYDFHGRPIPEGQPDPTTEEPSELEAAILRWIEELQ
jgi:hypothetical protein